MSWNLSFEFRKSKTDMGSPVETNLPDKEHNHIVKMLDRMEKLTLKLSDGKYTLLDIYSDPELRKFMSEWKKRK